MYGAILVPLDGSTFGEAALPTAIELARLAGARLHIAHVRSEWPLMWGEVPANVAAPAWSGEDEYMRKVTAQVHEGFGHELVSAILEPPEVDALVNYITTRHIGLVVMTTHGRSGLSRAWLGSVATELLRHLRVPMLLIRPPESGRPEPVTLRRILVPLDGSPRSQRILSAATELGRLAGARYTLVTVVRPSYVLGSYVPEGARVDAVGLARDRERADHYLAETADLLRQEGHDVETAVLVGVQASHAILQYADEIDADVIAMATHGYGALGRLAFGSVADKVVRGGQRPVLTLRTVAEVEGASDADDAPSKRAGMTAGLRRQ
jgi:nucleotide-binding universal stress UspA family protein